MKKLLLTTACLFVLGGQAYAAPCNAQVRTLQKQVNAEADKADGMTNRCVPEWHETVKRFLVLTQKYQEAAKRDKGCKINPPDMIGITLAVIEEVRKDCLAKAGKPDPFKSSAAEEAEMKNNRLEWEQQSRNEVPKTKPVVPAAVKIVLRANALLKGDSTCSQMRAASKLLEKAGDIYGNSNAKESGDGTLRTLSRRVGWLEDRADNGECRK
jgi:hypothetical protein